MGGRAFVPVENGPNWWRDVPGYNGKYRVSRNADVQRVFPSGLVRSMTPYRKQYKTRRRGLFVKLTAGGRSKEVPVLRIMAEAWHGEEWRVSRDEGLVPYHKNGIVTDDRDDNIGFISRRELGRLTGHRTDKRRCVFKVSQEGEEVEVYRSAREAARENNMSYQTVLDRCHGKVKNPFALDGYTYRFEK